MNVTVTLLKSKQECYEHCKQKYVATLGQRFVMERGSNDYHFTMVCKTCRSRVVTATRCRVVDEETGENDNTFELHDHGLSPDHPNPKNPSRGCTPCVSRTPKSSFAEMSRSAALGIAVGEGSGTRGGKFYKSSMSVQGRQSMATLEGLNGVTHSDIKKVTAMLKVSPAEHVESYDLIEPYFTMLKELNPGLAYDIEPKTEGVFERLCVVMPYTQSFLPNMLNVFGVDGGFMPKIKLKGMLILCFLFYSGNFSRLLVLFLQGFKEKSCKSSWVM